MEIILGITILLLLISIAVSAFFYAESRQLRTSLDWYKNELPLWQNKVLVKEGRGVLGIETKPKEVKEKAEVNYPKFVSPSELRARRNSHQEEEAERPAPISSRRTDTVKKAEEIINHTRG